MEKDYYKILGIERNATQDEIKKAFRKKAFETHPDRNPDNPKAKDMFADVNEAYSVLSDKDKKQRYDSFGSADGAGPSGGFSPFDFFSHFGRGGFGPFGFNGFSRSPKSHSSSEDGSDVSTSIDATFKQSVLGCTKEFTLNGTEECSHCHGTGVKEGSQKKTCARCNGSGQIVQTETNGFVVSRTISECPECHGAGEIFDKCPHCNGMKRQPKKHIVAMKIPPNTADGQVFRLAGKGECGCAGGKDGDLYVKVRVGESKLFKRLQGKTSLLVELDVSPIVATLGGEVEVPTLSGKASLKIPAGTRDGTLMRLKEKGIKDSGRCGDLYVKICLQPLANLSESQRRALQELQSSLTSKNTSGAEQQDEEYEKFCQEKV